MNTSLLLKISAVLWVIWGLVHAFAGIMVLKNDAATAVQLIADGVKLTPVNYPDAAGAIINQHGWNLLWVGVVTTIGAVYIWRKSATAILVTAMLGGLFDLGYFMFLDLGGFVSFIPGTVMTIVSSLAIILSFIAYFKNKQ